MDAAEALARAKLYTDEARYLPFSLPVGGTSGPIATADGTVIVRVTEHTEIKPDDLRKNHEAFRAEMP